MTDLDALAWPRRTARLQLRPARPEDAPAVWPWRRLPEVADWLSVHYTDEAEHVERFTATLDRTVVALLDGRIVATGKIDVEDAWGQSEVAERARNAQAEIGWVLDPAVQGQGYGTELARELIAICWELGVRRVVALAFADNVASLRVMKKAGMRREALFRGESLHRTRGWVDGTVYAVLRDEAENV